MDSPGERRRRHRTDFLQSLYRLAHGNERALIYLEEVAATLEMDVFDARMIAQSLAEKRLLSIRLQNILCLTQAGLEEVEAGSAHQEPPAILNVASGLEAPALPTFDLPAEQDVFPSQSFNLQRAGMAPTEDPDLAAAELRQICAALGLDPKEITGGSAEHRSSSDSPLADRAAHSSPFHHDDARRPGNSHRALLAGLEATVHAVATPAPVSRPASAELRAGDLDLVLESLRHQLPLLQLHPDDLAELKAEIDTVRAQLTSPRLKTKIVAASLETILETLENGGTAPLTSHVVANLFALREFERRLEREPDPRPQR